ncbi:tetratricopeptide repeat protein [Cupriavidus necator]|uniref:tetratricopeptide repeat protein n=1 Tax=Cupriavidus necator TaxID=106590 RepID=UPI00339D50A9
MHAYTFQEVQTVVGISRSVINAMLAAGLIVPGRGARNEYLFSFQDLVLFRTAQSLRAANVPTREVIRSLKRLERFGADKPATGMRIKAVGGAVTVADAHGQWQIESGQRIMDFDPDKPGGAIVMLDPLAKASRNLSGYELFEIAQDLERDEPGEAERAYRSAIAADPTLVDAYLNLGCMLCDRDSYMEAIALYRQGLEYSPAAPLLHFNLAVALEDERHVEAALSEYHACIRLAPDFADAHYNAARLHESLGDTHRAIRHYQQYRRLASPR